MVLAHLGELSAAASALQAAPLAPVDQHTLEELWDPAKRPRERQIPLPTWLADYRPSAGPLALIAEKLCTNLRGARRGAAAGPSGGTAEHLRVLLDDEECTDLMFHAASSVVRGEVPPEVVEGFAHRSHGRPQQTGWRRACTRHGRCL